MTVARLPQPETPETFKGLYFALTTSSERYRTPITGESRRTRDGEQMTPPLNPALT